MNTQFRMDSKPSTLVVVGGGYEPWLAVLEQVGWQCIQCVDLRKADQILHQTGPCIGLVNLCHDEFSLTGVANLVSSHKQVRWLAVVRESQINSMTICQFIVNFCMDFFTMPIPDRQLVKTIGHQLGMLTLEKRVWPHYQQHKDELGLTGRSTVITQVKEQIWRIAPTDVSVLIAGELGSGKRRVAQAIHRCSARAEYPFISLACNTLTEAELLSTLFGSEENPASLLWQAHQGTLLLEHIEKLSPTAQLKLSQFLHTNQAYSPQGMIEVNVRLLATSCQDLDQAVNLGQFNADLYHYISVLQLHMPSLRERVGDIAALAEQFLVDHAKHYNVGVRHLSKSAQQALLHYDWPNNVQELKQKLQSALLTSDNLMLEAEDLALYQHEERRTLKVIRQQAERNALLQALEISQGLIHPAAKRLGISRATMYRLLNKHEIEVSEALSETEQTD